MSTALVILNKWKSIDVSLSAQIAIEETATDAARVQKDQLFQGVYKSEDPIKPAYSQRTVSIKRKKGQPTDRVTLKDTGDFYKGILIDVRGDLFVIDSADPKSRMLKQKYGEDIFGLGEKARIEYVKTLQPEFLKQVRGYLK